MPRKGLTKDTIVDTAIELIETEGYRAFSLNELARRLDIKPASLYNHFRNIEELTDAAGSRIAAMLRQKEHEAIARKSGDEAVIALCNAYRSFAKEHFELYQVNTGRQIVGNDFEKMAKGEIIDPIRKVLADFRIKEENVMDWHRILRAIMHGCVTQEYSARIRNLSINHDKTYRMSVETVLLGIHTAEKEGEYE